MGSDERLRESLSAVWDSEANEIELHRVLAEVHDDSALRETAHRYQLLGSVMRNETPALGSIDLSAAIRDAIAEEAPHSLQESSSKYRALVSSVGRVAVAASVTVAVLFGVQTYNYGIQQTAVGGEAIAQAPQVIQQPAVLQIGNHLGASGLLAGYGIDSVAPSSASVELAQKKAGAISHQRLQTYMLQHAENNALRQYRGMLPFARLVNAESR